VVRAARIADETVAGILRPRSGLVEEVARPGDPASWTARRGPVSSYERSVRLRPEGDGTTTVEQEVSYVLDAPLVAWVLRVPTRRHLGAVRVEDRPPWWGPPDVLDSSQWAALGGLLTLALVVGYLGTLLTQTITYSAKEFHVGTGAEGVALAVVRCDIVLSLGLMTIADRRGRRVVMRCEKTAESFSAIVAFACSPILVSSVHRA